MIIGKKVLKLFVIAFAVSFMCGCEDNSADQYYTSNYYGIQMETIKVTAYRSAWQLTGIPQGSEGCYMYQEFDFPEIDDNVMNGGAVLVYYSDPAKKDNLLPLVLPYTNVIENLRFEYVKGLLTIIVEASDFTTAARTSDMEFKVCILK